MRKSFAVVPNLVVHWLDPGLLNLCNLRNLRIVILADSDPES